MSTCVNLSLKEFKDCCERLNVSAATLEPIVHEYINTVGGENSFPTDAYIERVIHGSEQPVLSEEQVRLWEKRYSQPAQFDDVSEAMLYITEAERFFPRESIGLKETLNGKIEVKVTKPIYVGPNTSLEEFAKEQERQEQEWREVQQRDAIEAEKLLIKQKAISDGTFMLAPNGKPTNLTEDQWLSVRTKAFKNWFGDWEKFTNISEEALEQVSLVFERNPELSKIGTIEEYAAYLKEIFPNSKDKEIYWHGSNSDFSQGFDSAIKGMGSGSPHIDGEFYLAKQAWTVLQYVNGVNRSFGPDVNGFNHWNKLWWELKEIMSNGRRENNDWKNLIIGPNNVRQAIPNKKGIFNRDSGGENGKWLKERKADYGYQDKTDAEFFKDVFGIKYGKDTFNTWTQRNAEVFKSLVKTESGIYPAVINATNPIRESGKNTYYELERGLLTQAKTKGNDTILGNNTDNEFHSDVAVVFNAKNNVHFLGTIKDITLFKQWLEKNRSSKVIDENGEPLVVYHGGAKGITEFRTSTEDASNTGYGFYTDKQTGEKIPVDSARTMFFSDNKHVAKSYAQLYALQYFKELRVKTKSAISTFYERKAYVDKDIFKTVDEFYDFLTIVSEFNPRFKKLKDYLKDIKSRGQRIKPNEIEEAHKLFKELYSNLKKYTEDWNLNSSSWDDILDIGANIINEYNSKEGIQRLKNGEIPEHIKKEWELYNKIQNHRKKHGLPELGNYEEIIVWLSSSVSFSDSSYRLIYNGTELILDDTRGQREIPISQLSNEQIEEFFNKAKAANIKSIEDRKKIDSDIKERYSKISDTYEVFLNIKNPLTHDYEGTHMGQGYKQSPKNSFGYVAARQVNKAIKEGYDGVVYENLYDPYLANNYGVFDPNQIKSAESNIGYSKEDNNIYHNKNLKDKYYKLLEYVKQNIKNPWFSLKDFNYRWGTNFGFNPRTKEITTRDERIHGISIWNPNDTKVEAKKKIDRVQLLNYLSAKFGLKFKEVSNEEYEKKAGSISNCCVIGDTVYIRKGDRDKLTNEQLIEEFLHPLVNAIYKSNPELSNKLLEEARNLFPDLTKQIAVAYANQSKQVQEEELITQVLSKYLNKEISDKGANTRTIANYIKQFFESILDLVKDLFGDVRIEKDTRLKISGKDIKTAFGFENLAQLINSKEITFTDVLGATEWRNNRTPKTFTFNDGITVNTSFTPNEQQVQALNEMSDFIESDETHMTLSGYAGTGKTSLMEMLAEKMNKQHRGIIFSASTNKAAAVLKARVAKSGFPAYTLNKVFGISVEVDPNKEYDAKDLITVLKDSDIIYPGAVVVIDEASMINEHNYNVLNGIAEQYGIKIIYVGDEAQLSPVKENKESKVFRDNDGRIARLTKVERTDDNAILKEATALRNGEELSGESSFNERGEGVAYISQNNKTTIREIVQRFVKGLKANPNYFRILAYTNKAVAKYNLAVRNALGYNDGIPRVGEPMTGYANWGYEYLTRTYRFINSEAYKVTRVGKPFTSTISVGGVSVTIESIPITLVDSFGKEDTFNYVDVKNNQSNLQAATALAKEKSRLWGLARRATGETKRNYLTQINTIDSYLFINDNITEGNRTIQAKVIDFGYAMTVHKSQGSTFTHVLVDDTDISKATSAEDNGIYEIDLEGNNVVKIGESGEKKIDVQQQLRYVAVSRATNTVSIISDNVKSEDSPLNHISEDEQFEEPVISVEQQPISNSYDEIFTPVQPIQQKTITEEEVEETIEDDIEQQFEDKQKEIDKAVKEAEEFITANNSFSEQVENLINSIDVNQSEITELANEVSYYMSDLITQWQDNPKTFFENFPSKRKETEEESIKWFNNLSRKQIIESIGIGNFLTIVKDRLFNDLNYDNLSDEEIDALDNKAMLFYNNFDALLRFGMSAFRSVEDFNINYSETGYKVEDVEKIDNNAEGNEFDNTNVEVVEDLGDKQEHWQIDSRTIDNFLSMSQIVKRELTRCYLTEKDESGNTVNKTNAFGVNKRVDPKNATASILRWTQGAINLDQMISKLKDKEEQYPWLTQIISKLEDRSGKYTDFQGQFFSVFCKHFQEYYYILETKDRHGNRIMSTRSANLNPALRDIMSGIEVAFRLHQHPLFDSKGVKADKFNKLIQAYNKLAKLNEQPFEALNIEQISIGISYVAELLGYNVSPEDVAYVLNADTLDSMLTAVSSIIDNIRKEATNPNYDPFAYSGKNSIGGYLRTFLTPITEHLEDIAISSFFDSGKMYQSYVIPSYLTKLMKKFKESSDEDFKTFLKEEYGDYEWFRDTSDKKMKPSSWKNVWLRELARMGSKKRKEVFGHKVLLNYNGHNYMRNMTSPEYILATLTEFLSDPSSDKEGTSTAWYKIPMMSNKPSFEFIKFLRYKGADYQDTLTTHLTDVFTQELERIQTVLMRGYFKSDPEYIKNFDENGKRFMFLEYLNPYLDHLNGELRGTELGKLINKKLKIKLSEEEDAKLTSLLKEVIKTQMNAKADAIIAQYKANGVFDLAKNIENIGKTEGDIENAIRNFVWNDTFASINILQLTITDTAYYANAEDVQKRLAQIHAPGMRGNVDATDYDGNPVSDGTFRTIFLKDFDGVKSNIIENLEIVFDRKIEQAPENEKEFWRNTKKAIISQFEDINVADAQAYNSPTSYRKKAFMFGKWSRKSEEIYQKLKKGEYNLSDLETAFQPLKPFVYSQATKKSGVEGSPIQNMKVNMQFKNSEYLLIMADAILQGEKTGKPNLLRAIYEVMEESAEKYPTQGIDTVQFESAVKAGLHARIDLNQCLDMENGEQVAKKLMETAIYNEDRGYYNTTYVHETPFEDYTIQQEVPAHFKDHEQAHGSQERMIIPSDLARVDANGETVYYTFTDNGVTKRLTAEEFRSEYENTIAESIKESIDRLYDELGLNIPDKKVRNVALSKILQKEILSSPRYGMDLYIACSVDKDGNFNIPLGDPIQSKRIEQLINSIIKNRVNKQKVAGGPVVQVTNYGTSTQLHIKFKDKEGNILPTLTEWLEKNPGKTAEDFKEFLKENQGGVAYYECYAPVYMQELLQDFMDEKGNLDMEAIEATNPELLDMIGYRIPSEDLYSVAPLRIKGFLPKEAGEGIMLPYEITLITGSDFDIDKFYLMRKEFNIKRRKTKEIEELLVKEFGESKRQVIQTFLHLLRGDKFDTFKKYPKYAKAYRRLAFIAEKPTKGRAYRNNKVIDMSLAVLTHETATDRLLNPGGFEPQKRMGYLIQAYKMGKGTWKELDAKSTNDLKKICMTDKNLSYIDVNTQFYEQNNVAGTILGMFAVQKVAHSALEGDKLCVNVSDVLGLPEGKDFGIAGKHFSGYMEFDATTNVKGEFIGKVLGSLVAAAADAVKDPVLNLMNINSTTANVLTTLIRLGIPFETASLLTSQDIITECLREFNLRNLSGFVSFRDVLNEKLAKLTEDTSKIERTNDINYENLSKAEMIQGLTPNASVEVKYKGLLTFIRALDIAMELKGPTFATRFNSISSAVGPLVANNIVTKHKVDSFSKHIYKRIKDATETNVAQYTGVEVNDIFNSHPILKYFHETLAIADTVFDDYIPANSDSFDEILSSLPENIRSKIMGDTKALGQLIDFYLSYLLISSKCIDVDSNRDLKYYMNEFPKSFVTENIKEKYPDNPFIQAIKVTTSQAADGLTRYTLVINTTGMDNVDKERLSSGWADLYNENPQYALQLFEYNFYKGGIGFTPKTFMHLLPISIKRNIPKYIETFRNLPRVDASTVIDQFIRNNWQNGKFVPRFNEDKISLNEEKVILNKDNYGVGLSTEYIRVRYKDKTEKLYKRDEVDVEGKTVTYKEISPLGNNGEYLEIATYNIEESLDTTPQVVTENPTHIPSYTNQEADNNEVIPSKITEEENKNYEEILLKVLGEKTLQVFRSKTKEQQEDLKAIYKEHFDALFAQKGVPYNPEEFEEIFKQFCGN